MLFAKGNRRAAAEPAEEGSLRPAGVRTALVVVVVCCLALVLSCWFGGQSMSAASATGTVSVAPRSEANVADIAARASADPVKAVCELIYQGKFDTAGERIRQITDANQPNLPQLSAIVKGYQAVLERRESLRKAAFKEQMAELEKLKTARPKDANDPNSAAGARASSGKADVNDANDAPTPLSVLARMVEFADSNQRSELFSDPFVKKTIQDAVDRAARLDSEGKWLDGYTSVYYWLHAIDPNNKGYRDYAEELLEKAAIAVFFQDSPCETHQERYESVKKEMFTRAIEAIDLQYVNSIDYVEMARKAVRRSKLVAEVVATAFAKGRQGSKLSFVPPTPDKLAVWSTALAAISDDVHTQLEGFGKKQFLGVFEKVLSLNSVIVELPEPALIVQFAEAALEVLDPYTVIIWPKQVQDFEKMMTNEFTGIGIEISKTRGLLTVASLLPDTPAYKAGLDADDVIERVDGVPTKDMSSICAVKKITGPKGTKVTLDIKRPGEEKIRTITLTRAKITVPTIRGWRRDEGGKWLYMVDQSNKIGYVRVTSFSGETAGDLEKVLDAMEGDGLRGLILDLRFDSGGLLETAVKVTDMFIKEGLIVKTQPRLGMIPTFEMAHKSGTHPDYPLVILMNSASASASEIVAGALADPKYNRVLLVGERTHGKGSVQGITHYPGGGAQMKYTMAYYHLPSGQRVKSREEAKKQGTEDWGIGPHVRIELRSDELRQMLEVQRDNDVLVQADRGQSRPAIAKHTVEETLRADPELAVGVLLVKAKLIEGGLPVVN